MYLLESTWPQSHYVKHMTLVKFMNMSKVRRFNFTERCSCYKTLNVHCWGPSSLQSLWGMHQHIFEPFVPVTVAFDCSQIFPLQYKRVSKSLNMCHCLCLNFCVLTFVTKMAILLCTFTIIICLSWSWATCWPVPVSRIQKPLQRSAMIPSAIWGIVFHYPRQSITRHSNYMLNSVSLVFQ